MFSGKVDRKVQLSNLKDVHHGGNKMKLAQLNGLNGKVLQKINTPKEADVLGDMFQTHDDFWWVEFHDPKPELFKDDGYACPVPAANIFMLDEEVPKRF